MSEEYKQYEKDADVDTDFQRFYEKEEDFMQKLIEIVKKVLIQGQLIIVATKQMGKTNSAMWLMKTLMEMKEHEEGKFKTLIFDLPMVWRFRFNRIAYLSHDSIPCLPVVKDLIVDLPYTDSIRTRNAITEIMMEDFVLKRQLKEKFEGNLPFKNIYLVEEMQNIWGTHSLNGSEGRFALKIFSECANYDMIIIGITQRLADVSTRIVERSRYLLIGNLEGDNNLNKIKRVTNKRIRDKVQTLKRGQFLFWDRESPEYIDLVYFPKFVQTGKPYLFEDKADGKGYVKRVWLGE